MRYFPQTQIGTGAQYPLIRRSARRTVVNEAADGTEVRYVDPAAATVGWTLELASLTDEERARIEELFASVEGRLGEFTFLDPTDNLLRFSEDLGSGVWVKGPLLAATGGVGDPWGGLGASRLVNGAQTAQRAMQEVGGAGGFHYCFSVFVRSAQPVEVTLVRTSGGVTAMTAHMADGTWRRVVSAGVLESQAENIGFGIELASGVEVEVAGLQVETQWAPSGYKRTHARAGVYPSAHFEEDRLTWTSAGPGQHATTIRIESPAGA